MWKKVNWKKPKKKIKVTDEDITAHAVVAGYDTIAATLALMSYKLADRDYVIEPRLPGEKPVYVEVNTSCWIPIYALHRDPQYYPNSDKFDPKRFSDENKNDIKRFTYLPFGAGPSGCVGA
ncbi:hypothetical protein ILUMI_14246 [Ignelater luminosus]|uniref:Cytochrome P450 n=1 Tax=Ignelater luminosus TaxID=2038154 RepID=A0A8K0G7X8_IGNLU|nr:hypothetical protein ILUMI_14246 [Ignelater luminosus]